MTLSKLSRLTLPLNICGAELTARALTIAESRRLYRRFPQYDFMQVVNDPDRLSDALTEISEQGQRAFVATCCGYGGDPDQEAAVAQLPEDEQDQIVGASITLTFVHGGVKFKGMVDGKALITIRGVDFKVQLLSLPMLDGLALRFPDLAPIESEPEKIFDCSEPSINAFIAAGVGCAGDPIEEAAAAHLNLVEQHDIIALMFGAVPQPASAPGRRPGLN